MIKAAAAFLPITPSSFSSNRVYKKRLAVDASGISQAEGALSTTGDQGRAVCRGGSQGEKSIRDLKELSATSLSRHDAKRMTGPAVPPSHRDGESEVRARRIGKGLSKRSDSRERFESHLLPEFPTIREGPTGVRKPPANFFECPKPGLVAVPNVHCTPIVIGYQRYFCLNCRTSDRLFLSRTCPARVARSAAIRDNGN